jgi:hypothetical protein
MKLLVSYQTFLIQTRSVYRHEKLRKLDLGSYILQQKAESAMVRDFRKRCGHHTNTFIVAGSWNCKTPRNLKNLAPVRGNRIKRIFQRAKYKVYIIDENRTSKACSKCCNHSNPNTGQSEMSVSSSDNYSETVGGGGVGSSVSSSDNYSETGGGGLLVISCSNGHNSAPSERSDNSPEPGSELQQLSRYIHNEPNNCNHSNSNTGQSEMSRSVSSSDNYSETGGGGGLPVEPETAKVCENFLVLSKGKLVKKHGIIKCSHCETIWNR